MEIESSKEFKDLYYLRLAYINAARYSKDPNTQTGAVLVDTNADKVISIGANYFAPGVQHTPERLNDRDTKLFYIEHAERNAIFGAARRGVRTLGLTLYAPWFACADCARAIICTGIGEVIGHKLMNDITPERWRKSIDNALDMLRESGVQLRWIDAQFPDLTLRFNNQVINLGDGQPISDPKLALSSV